jgi:hypothetical protein
LEYRIKFKEEFITMSDVVTETNMENVDSVDKINRYRIITDEKDPNYAVKKVKYNDEEV